MTVPGFAVPWKGVCWPEWNQRQQRLRASGDSTEAEQALEYGFVDHIRASAADVVGGGGTDAN